MSQRVADVCLGALAQVVPDQLGAASQGTMNNVLLGGDGWVYYETVGGGQGARPWADGMSGVQTAMTNTRDTPVEALERALPIRVRRYALRRGSGGAGRHAGGDGIEREIEMLEGVTVSLVTERRRSAPWGMDGGAPGTTGENWLLSGGKESEARRLPDKCTVELTRRRRAADQDTGWRRLRASAHGRMKRSVLDGSVDRAHAHDFDLEGAARSLVADGVSRPVAEQRLAER